MERKTRSKEKELEFYKSKVKELEESVSCCERNIDDLLEINKTLKASVGSYKAANTRYRKEIEKLKEYAQEADELNEQKAEKILSLNKYLEEMTIQRDNAIRCSDSSSDSFYKAKKEIAVLKANIEWYSNLPWYIRIFKKFPTTI